MQATIEPTDKIVYDGAVRLRVWKGRTDKGTPFVCLVFAAAHQSNVPREFPDNGPPIPDGSSRFFTAGEPDGSRPRPFFVHDRSTFIQIGFKELLVEFFPGEEFLVEVSKAPPVE